MAVSDHGNFDLAIELTEELLTSALLAGVPAPVIPTAPRVTQSLTVVPQLTAVLTRADTRPAAAPTVALLGTLSGKLVVQTWTLPVSLPGPTLRDIVINAQFAVIATPTIGTVGGARGVVLSTATARVELTLGEEAVLSSFVVQQVLILAYLTGGEAAYLQRRQDILINVRDGLTAGLRTAVSGIGSFLAVPEPAGVSFRALRTTEQALKLLITVVPPDGNPARVSGLTVRRNSLGGPLDHCVVAISNAHLLGTIAFPALTAALGIPGTPSRPEHPALLVGPIALPGASFGIPTLTGIPGAPIATPFLDFLLAQVTAAGLRVDVTLRMVSFGGYATVTMRATVILPLTATVVGGTLTMGLGVPAVATTTDISIDPIVYVVSLFTGGVHLAALLVEVDLFGGGYIDGFVADTVVPMLPARIVPPVALPLAGPFAALAVNLVQTSEPTAPARTVTVGGLTLPLDRVNDVFIRLL